MPRPPKKYMHDGKMMTTKEIAVACGISYKAAQCRVRKGQPLDMPKYHHPKAKRAGDKRRKRQASVERINGSAMDNRRGYVQDIAARALRVYFERGEVLHSAQEIAEMFGCGLESGVRIREWLRRELFSNATPTLEQIGDCHGIGRERARQLQDLALVKLRTNPRSKLLVREMRENAALLHTSRGHALGEESTAKEG